MAESKDFVLISLVAIVAIVGLVVLFMSGASNSRVVTVTQPDVVSSSFDQETTVVPESVLEDFAASLESENVAGAAISVLKADSPWLCYEYLRRSGSKGVYTGSCLVYEKTK